MAINDYINDVIRKGDKGSALLHALCAPTLENQKNIISIISDGMNGLVALNVPKDYNVAVFSAGGNPKEKNLENHTLSASLESSFHNQQPHNSQIQKELSQLQKDWSSLLLPEHVL